MGLTSLESFDHFVAINRRNYDTYRQALSGLRGVELLTYQDGDTPNFGYVAVELDEGQVGLGRDAVYRCLHAENVLARRYFYPGCHRMEPYRTLFPEASLKLPHTEAVARRILIFPTGTGVEPATVDSICGLLGFFIEHAPEIRARLS